MVLDNVTVKKVLIVTALNIAFAGGSAFFGYLKTHPLPEWDGVYKRTTDQGIIAPVNVRDAAPPSPNLADAKDATKP